MAMWAALVFMSGVFMGGLTTLHTDSKISQKLGKGFGLLAILYGLILFLGALTGGTNPIKPLASVNFGAGGGRRANQRRANPHPATECGYLCRDRKNLGRKQLIRSGRLHEGRRYSNWRLQVTRASK